MPAPRDIANGVLKDLVKGSVVHVESHPGVDLFPLFCAAEADLAMLSRATKQTRIAPIPS